MRHIGLTTLMAVFLLSCSAPPIQTSTPGGEPGSTATAGTPAADPGLVQAATLFRADFEHGYPPELYGTSELWRVQQESDGNSAFCNQSSVEWVSARFGMDDWQDYVLTLRMKFLSDIPEQQAEAYARIDSTFQGYRASIWNNETADLGFYAPYRRLDGSPVSVSTGEWLMLELRLAGKQLRYSLNGETVAEVSDDSRTSGRAGFGASPGTEVCVDDVVVQSLDRQGNLVAAPPGQVVEPFDGIVHTIREKLANRPTVPVFYPWAGTGEGIDCGQAIPFDCDSGETPYSLVWTGEGTAMDLESAQPAVSEGQSNFMRSDDDTLYIVSEEWHYWCPGWRSLSSSSRFYLEEVFQPHQVGEYCRTLLINFEHPDWPGLLGQKARNFQAAGFDGMLLDWWNDDAGNGRDYGEVQVARKNIAQAIREQVGPDFVLMGNVNWNEWDLSVPYLSGVFLELGKIASEAYTTRASEERPGWHPSIERMENLLRFWDTNLQWPKVIAFEPCKVTTGDYAQDRYTAENIQYARLFTAMALVIPENGYILYADNNADWTGGDHQHAYYDFYLTDLGKPTSGMVQVSEGVAYKLFERGIVAYNRTDTRVEVVFPGDKKVKIGPLEGLFLAEH